MGFMDNSVGDPPTDDDDDASPDPETDAESGTTTESTDDNPLTAPDKAEMGTDDDTATVTDDDAEDADAAADSPDDDADNADESDGSAFESQLRTLVASNRVPSLDTSVVEAHLADITDTRLLKLAFEAETRDDARRLYATRYEDLKEGTDSLMPEVADGSDAGTEKTCSCSENEACDDCPPSKFESGDADEPAVESEDAVTDGGPETAESDDSGGAPSNVGTIDISDIAPQATSVQEAADRESRWTILAWAEPGKGKSHFAYTMPDPIVFIDTEGKANELAEKFTTKDIHIFTPSNYDEARDAAEQGLAILDRYRVEQDRLGTIVVDSMSDMWEWSQSKYVDVYYPNQSPEEVNFQSQMQTKGQQSDWKQIKSYHNAKFRQPMIESPYHLCWTAMEQDDFDAVLNDGERRAKKPAGEKTNVYKVDEVYRIREDAKGRPVGELHKSGKIKHRYTGLTYPTFEKHQEVVEAIKKTETGGVSPSAVPSQTGYDVTVVEGNPKYLTPDDD